ncbi:RTA-like protein [Fusarium oxysporum f. sp. albedinis]|nr:RTA-like protein [Fusarium oxysporum f. sp. albedinis]
MRANKISFVLGDIFSFMVQSGGSGMSALQDAESLKKSERIVIIGLMIQIIIFGLFCTLALLWYQRIKLVPVFPITPDVWILYGVSLFILVRSIFWVIKCCQGYTGYTLSYEWILYVLDMVLMFAAAGIFYWGK